MLGVEGRGHAAGGVRAEPVQAGHKSLLSHVFWSEINAVRTLKRAATSSYADSHLTRRKMCLMLRVTCRTAGKRQAEAGAAPEPAAVLVPGAGAAPRKAKMTITAQKFTHIKVRGQWGLGGKHCWLAGCVMRCN